MDEERLKAVLESLLFASGEPVSLARLVAVLEPVTREAIRKALADLKDGFHRDGRGVMLEEVAGGYQLRTPREHALYVRRLLSARPPRLSRPMMETLAIIAYRQPITRPEIEQLRGVDSGAVLETLTERRLVKIAGRKEAPGRPMMYATTSEFLQTFGLKDLDSLPDLSELREVEQQIEAAGQQRAAEDGEGVASPDQLELLPPHEQPPEQLPLTEADAEQAAEHEAEPSPSKDSRSGNESASAGDEAQAEAQSDSQSERSDKDEPPS